MPGRDIRQVWRPFMTIAAAIIVAELTSQAAPAPTQPKRTEAFAPQVRVDNLRVEQPGGGVIYVWYDLVSTDPSSLFAITLEVSLDGGTTFRARSVTGDVGPRVAPGAGKRIAWDYGQDVEQLQIDRFRYRVRAEGVAVGPAPPSREPTRTLIERALRAIGGDVDSLQIAASGASFTLGQGPLVGFPWPGVGLKSYAAVIDYATPAMRQEMVRTQLLNPPPGVIATSITGETRQVAVVSGDRAWMVTRGNTAVPASAAVVDLQTFLWSTPHGFLRAAKASDPAFMSENVGGRKLTRITFTAPGNRRMSGLLNQQDKLERIETWVDNPVLGDMLVETSFSDYKPFGSVTFPTLIVQKKGGHATVSLTVSSVEPNVAADFTVPPNIETGIQAPPIRVEVQKLADGVWYLVGGSHHSVAVEFRDHIVVIEGPQNEARSTAVIDEVRRIISRKPIRYLVNTHFHFDHSGGLRTYAAQGATIVTHQLNRTFYERAFAASRTINPDMLALSKRTATFETVVDRKVMTDGAMTLELHEIRGNPHSDGFLMAYLPNQKLLIEADAWNPRPASVPAPTTPNSAALNLYENIQRLGLEATSIVPLHGRVSTLDDLAREVGNPRQSRRVRR
jgi:glyoxylase-like metal-dependent hydrolase (beta-lactamase superfamily II)